ncbi:MAG: vitamin K epoxide reductase family protein [Chitinophagaceae bacterium]
MISNKKERRFTNAYIQPYHMPSFETIICTWLSSLSIRISPRYLTQQLQSHSDYPSLLSITDTLQELAIEHAAIQIEKEQLPEIPVPFLAHLTGNGGEWVIIKNRDNLDKQFPHFFERWKGTVLAAEKTSGWSNKQNEKMLAKERQQQQITVTAIGFITLLAISGLIVANNSILAALLLTATAGIFISWLVVSKDLGIENKLADQVCGATANCNEVIKSNAAKLPGGLSWGDIGLSWFSFQVLITIITSFMGTGLQLVNLLSLVAVLYIPFALFSLYYQWRIAKKWCRLCLMVVGILIVQAVILLPPLIAGNVFLPDFSTISLTVFVLFITVIAWLALKELWKKNRQLQTANGSLQRFKNNADLFNVLLKKERTVNTTPWKNDFQLGNPDAPVQLLVACNPYCGPCAKAHTILDESIEMNKELGVTIRFTINAANKEDSKTAAIEYLLQLVAAKQDILKQEELASYKRELLHHWFEWMDRKKFEEQYPLRNKINVDELLIQQEEWSKEANIKATPTIFVNGYELPKAYSIADLGGLVRGIKKEENTAQPATMEVL